MKIKLKMRNQEELNLNRILKILLTNKIIMRKIRKQLGKNNKSRKILPQQLEKEESL
jgi:hypothetical protein